MQNDRDPNRQLAEELMKTLGPEDKKKLDSILADKAATQKILQTPEAQKLLTELLGGKFGK